MRRAPGEFKGDANQYFAFRCASATLSLMPRVARVAPPGIVYHVLNRANGRLRLFKKPQDFLAFEQVLLEAHRRTPIRILDWCIMPNHWHMVLWPEREGELSEFLRWLTLTHAQRWKHAHRAVGHGHLYQGRFKSFPVQRDEHLLSVLRYVERNPLRAGLVRRAQAWRWGSCHVREHRLPELNHLLSEWPIDRPRRWLERVNTPQTPQEEAALRESIVRNRPFGAEPWVKRTAQRLNLQQTLRSRGRPVGWRKAKSAD
jgi:putative transposase